MPATIGGGFTLTKWYLDCVDPEGRAFIGFWTSLSWRGVGVIWQSIVLDEPSKPALQRSSSSPVAPPLARDGKLEWKTPELAATLTADARQSPLAVRLFASRDGVVDWRCEAPVAAFSVEIAGHPPIRGLGYAEQIVVTTLPWKLPIRELRWGRWSDDAAARSIVWIDWRGREPRTWVFVDGAPAVSATVSDESVQTDGFALAVASQRAIRTRAFSDLVRAIPPLRAVVPASFLALEQNRWLGCGTLREGGSPPRTGWTISERVVFM
jgi:hypothetical protein